jgi:hypothetical protein
MTNICVPSWTCVSKCGLLFDEGGVGVSAQELRLLHRTVTASRSLWTLCNLCHCTILSKDNIKMDVREIGRGVMDWGHLARDRD